MENLTQEQIYQQWYDLRPYIYKHYQQHLLSDFTQVICSKFCKQQLSTKTINKSKKQKKILNFIICGIQRYQQQFPNYTYTNHIIKSYEYQLNLQGQNRVGNYSPKQIRKIIYQKQITCVQTLMMKNINKNQSNQQKYQYGQVFAIALDNDSIRLITGLGFKTKSSFNVNHQKSQYFNSNSPFLKQNIPNLHQYCMSQQIQIGIIPMKKKITTMKHKKSTNRLLVGCSDGQIVLVEFDQLFSSLQKNNKVYKSSDMGIKCVCWLSQQQQQFSKFASCSQNSLNILIYIQSNPSPILSLPKSHSLPICNLYNPNPYQLISIGNDCLIKFWDFQKERNFVYQTSTKSYVSCLVGIKDNQNQKENIRFVTGNCKGEVVVWGSRKEFVHLAHQSGIANVDHIINHNQQLFIACQRHVPKISIFSPIIQFFQKS